HRQLLTIRADGGSIVAERMLDASVNRLVFELGEPPAGALEAAGRFFSLGIHHIVTGYDHLLFLAAMLLVVRRFREGVAIITAFSAAHAVALVLASLGFFTVPSQVVEPLIAASIVWVGVENLVRRNVTRRWVPAFGFGLIHGLAFASALSDFAAADSGGSLAVRLAFFNLGIEAGQLAFALLALPLLWHAARWPGLFSQARAAGSMGVAAAGTFWLIERCGVALAHWR
ncbi:MAG: HupE/UreJ family protein, partial [Steroidobacteraceae bacterium]